MKKISLAILTAAVCSLSTAALAQAEADKPAYTGGFLENFGVGLKGGTTGIGGDFSTSFHPNIKARIGFSYFWLNYSPKGFGGESVTDPRDGSKHILKWEKGKASYPNANLLVDLFPMRSGIFHFTVGLFFGRREGTVYGRVPSNLPSFIYDKEYEFFPNPDGTVSATLYSKNTVNPYVGIGLGRTITKRRIGFKFDLGATYFGKSVRLTSDNLDQNSIAKANVALNNSTIFNMIIFQLSPVMAVTLSYRIK
jgi:hypothetical protein